MLNFNNTTEMNLKKKNERAKQKCTTNNHGTEQIIIQSGNTQKLTKQNKKVKNAEKQIKSFNLSIGWQTREGNNNSNNGRNNNMNHLLIAIFVNIYSHSSKSIHTRSRIGFCFYWDSVSQLYNTFFSFCKATKSRATTKKTITSHHTTICCF